MKTKVFTIYDSKVESYMSPFMAPTAGHALRMFADTVNDDKTTLNKHPEDFTLFEIGEYDDSTAKYTNLEALKSLGTAIEYKRDDK